ncbi:hypothetical protein [Nocardia huaxiensis]|uniref:hypothetical protein n=1 Tax=Nocardia huaxiensis TaxID=2755382 RepID=UPI001E609420|nr:hypothetical protein [Nocardia huaxiensis]UFS96966.1 hypothetical protein LPY97_03250 [Nocardia huaxiensis]
MTMRPDLLALTDDSLISLANRGIFKRAVKENSATPPALTESPDGTVEVVFHDGIRTTLPPGTTLEAAPCTCSATTVCRHRVMAVLAYRASTETPSAATAPNAQTADSSTAQENPALPDDRTANEAAVPVAAASAGSGNDAGQQSPASEAGKAHSTKPADVASTATWAKPWSPGDFTDDQLRELLGPRAFTAARRAHRSGYRAIIRRGTASDPVPSVELSAVTVRFLVPNEIGYARADAARGSRTDAIALAVWAFRVADVLDPDTDSLEVTVGAATDGSAAVTATASVLSPLADLVNDGVSHAGPDLAGVFTAATRALDSACARWPHDALTDLLDQLSAYRDRSARHDPLRTASLITELVARHRASARDWVPVLGTEEAAQTPLRHLRLTGLGARVTGDDESRSLEVYLAHPEARIVLTLHHTVAIPEGTDPPSPTALAARRTGTARYADLAAGNVVTESAVRSANRTVRLATSRVARTSVLPSSGDWSKLPPELLLTDLDAEAARLAALPPSLVRPRVRGESLRAVEVAAITEIRYLPGEQRLEATLEAPTGTAILTYTHTAATPGAIDSLAHLLSGESGPVRYIAGTLERHHGRLTLTPTALVVGTTVHIPAFATADRPIPPGTALPQQDPLLAATTSALSLTAEVPHRGARHLPPTWFDRATTTATTLRRLGLTSAATSLDALRHSLTTPTTPTTLHHWTDTHLRLLLTAEQL